MRQLLDQVEQITKEQAYQRVRSVECVWASMLVRTCACTRQPFRSGSALVRVLASCLMGHTLPTRVDVGVAMIVSAVA